LSACEKTNVLQDGTLGSHEDRISALEKNFESFTSGTNSKVQTLQDLIGNMGGVPSSGGGSADTSQFQMAIVNLQSDLKSKANQSDFDSLKDSLNLKADKSLMNKEINRLDALIEELRQGMSGFLDK
jgi:hypothetical protein